MALHRILGVTGLALIASCSGPERAPHQPIQGVDTPETKVDNPHDRPADRRDPAPIATTDPVKVQYPGTEPVEKEAPVLTDAEPSKLRAAAQTTGDFLDPFVQRILDAHRQSPGIIAVFPALTKDPETGAVHVNGLGDHLANETAHRLEMAGTKGVLSGHSLQNDIKASNRGLDSFRGLDDVYWLGDRLGASYIVFGSTNKRVFDRMYRDEQLEVDWQCRRLNDRGVVASFRERLGHGALATELTKHYRQTSDWKIAGAAGEFQASADAELRIAAKLLAQQVASKHTALLRDRTVCIPPTAIRTLAGERASLQAWAFEFERAFDAAEKQAAQAGNTDSVQAALATGPVTIGGKEYPNHGAALDAFKAKAGALSATPAGELSLDLSRMMSERLRETTGEQIKIVNDTPERDALLSMVHREARAQADTEGIDPLTGAALRARGAQVLVASSLRPYLKSYQLRLVLHDLKTGQMVTEAMDLDEQFKDSLDKVLSR